MRKAPTQNTNKPGNSWDINLHPNPTANKVTIQSNTENDVLTITINDLTGRNLLNKEIKLNGFFANLDLALINGVYIVNIRNKNNAQLTKKLLITK